VQLEVLAELLRHNKVERRTKQLDTTRGHVREGLAEARQSIWALRSQDSGRENTAGDPAARDRAGGWPHGIEAKFQRLSALIGLCRRVRSARYCAWRKKPSIM
jgi:signal transduction histidine kinase